MAEIALLPPDVVAQIAAGEVVERPASVLKELVENALDAGATEVEVETTGAGEVLLSVSDDGEGIAPPQVPLVFTRHATSKITRAEDLARVRTYGFRGEAVASIAAVARVRLLTAPRGGGEGVDAVAEGGGEPQLRPAVRRPGTTVEVRDLFFNVPARKKFLRSPATEVARLVEVVENAALSRPSVGFRFRRNGTTELELPSGQGEEERARAIASPRGSVPLFGAESDAAEIRVRLLLAPPEASASSPSAFHLLVNARPVRDRALFRALADSMRGALPQGRSPRGVVRIDLPPDEVDVNVHPTKAEVRFRRPSDVSAVLRGAAGRWITEAAWLKGGLPPVRGVAVAEATERYLPRREGAPAVGGGFPVPSAPRPFARQGEAAPGLPLPRPGFYGSLRVVAQVFATYFVCEGEDSLYLVDQHAAHERANFLRLESEWSKEGIAGVPLAPPLRVELKPAERAGLEEAGPLIERLGVGLRPFGGDSYLVERLPRGVRPAEARRFLEDLLAGIPRAPGGNGHGAPPASLKVLACHASVRAGDRLALEEGRSLLAELDRIERETGASGYHCPHGRPILHRIPVSEVERIFRRRT